MSEDLKSLPCPFCGAVPGVEDVIGEYIDGTLYTRLRCPNADDTCMAEGPWVEFGISDDDYPVDAVTLYESSVSAWNRRVKPEELPEWLIDELINGLVLAKDDKTEGWNDALEWVLSLKKEDSA